MTIYLVREYDYEMQEVRFAAASLASAQAFVEGVRTVPCSHEPDWHTEDWPASDCVDAAQINAERLKIEEWEPDAIGPVRLGCPRPGCTFTIDTEPMPPGDPIYRHICQDPHDIPAEPGK